MKTKHRAVYFGAIFLFFIITIATGFANDKNKGIDRVIAYGEKARTLKGLENIPGRYLFLPDGIHLKIEKTEKHKSGETFFVRLINKSNEVVSYKGYYGGAHPIYYEQKLENNKWEYYMQGVWCGTGLGTLFVPSNKSVLLKMDIYYVRKRGSKASFFRLGLPYQMNEGATKNINKKNEELTVWTNKIKM